MRWTIIVCVLFASCTSSKSILSPVSKGKNITKKTVRNEVKKKLKKELRKIARTGKRENNILMKTFHLTRIEIMVPLLEEIKSKNYDFVSFSIKREKKKKIIIDSIAKWRVQLASFFEKKQAEQLRLELNKRFNDQTFIIKSMHLFKVQIGNYKIRVQADQLLQNLKESGYESGWVTKVFEKSNIFVKPVNQYINRNLYRIQIASFSDKLRADALKEEVKLKLSVPVIIFESKSLFKVLVSSAKEKEMLKKLLQELNEMGYSGWISNSY